MIEYTEEVAGILAVQLYDAPACRAIVEQANNVDAWMEAKVSEHGQDGDFNSASRPEARLARVLSPAEHSAVRLDFDEKMERIIKPLVRQIWRVDLRQHSETHFVRYGPGHYYTPHSDTGLNRTDRYFTAICYLNEDFTGGHTSFPQLNHSVTPRCGKAIIFPATYLHCAEPVHSGEKYILVSWLTAPPPTQWI
jgi:predicted 2-oxoglutarate/Fe(II)-dependent dioxygenase YbiX